MHHSLSRKSGGLSFEGMQSFLSSVTPDYPSFLIPFYPLSQLFSTCSKRRNIRCIASCVMKKVNDAGQSCPCLFRYASFSSPICVRKESHRKRVKDKASFITTRPETVFVGGIHDINCFVASRGSSETSQETGKEERINAFPDLFRCLKHLE